MTASLRQTSTTIRKLYPSKVDRHLCCNQRLVKFVLLPLLRLSRWEIVVKWKLTTEFQNSSIGTSMQITQLEAYGTSSTGTFINISTLSVSNYERLTSDSSLYECFDTSYIESIEYVTENTVHA